MFRIQDKTPEVYTNTSRDFQLIGRLYDCIINGIKFDVDSILDITDTDNINSRLLKLLQTKLGFFTNKDITDDNLRYILEAFPIIIKNKGSLKGIEQAVSVFLKLNHIKSDVKVEVINNSSVHPYIIKIYLNMSYTDTYILDEILKYILPTGYIISYSFYNDVGSFDTFIDSKIGANLIILKDSVSSLIRGNYIAYKNTIEDNLIGSVGETQLALPYNTTYMGVVNNDDENYPNTNLLPSYSEDKEKHVGELYTLRYGHPEDNNFILWSCIYMINPATDQYDWVVINSLKENYPNNDIFDVFDSAIYGYYKNSNEFYYKKESGFEEDSVYSATGLELLESTEPTNAKIATFQNGKLYDPISEKVWFVLDDVWVDKYKINYGLEILGNDPNIENNYIIPKKDLIVYREANNSLNVLEAVWTTVLYNNNYIWGNIITDSDKINELKEKAIATIEGNPSLAKINDVKDNYIYNNILKKSWYLDNDIWIEENLLIEDSINITGNPNVQASIIPNENIHIYNSNLNISWSSYIDNYTEQVQPQDFSKTSIYIDKDTSCGYKYTDIGLEEVLHFVKASHVYNITPNELDYMIDNNLLKPAFKNDTIIFEDIYNNMFLL
jgi:hypothetical protein